MFCFVYFVSIFPSTIKLFTTSFSIKEDAGGGKLLTVYLVQIMMEAGSVALKCNYSLLIQAYTGTQTCDPILTESD